MSVKIIRGVPRSHASCENHTRTCGVAVITIVRTHSCIHHTCACHYHAATYQNHTFRVEITLVCDKITLVRVVITFVRDKITLLVEIALCV
jgi:hypothetical protein